jgi:hypothetical protein
VKDSDVIYREIDAARHECRACGRALPKRAYRAVCASCGKRERGYVNAFVPVGILPGLVTVYRREWLKR